MTSAEDMRGRLHRVYAQPDPEEYQRLTGVVADYLDRVTSARRAIADLGDRYDGDIHANAEALLDEGIELIAAFLSAAYAPRAGAVH